tara:strand:- start:1037 stop:1774 length:738 start_codon:yes stop_codon:yes gene_type:complete
MPNYHVTVSSFGSLPSHVKIANNNGIRITTGATSEISSLAGALNITGTATIVAVGAKINNGALLDEDLKEMIQTIQQQFITTYMDFSMNDLRTNIQNGYEVLDPSTNKLSRTIMANGVPKTTTENLMGNLNAYVQKVKSLPKNADISNNETEMIKQDDAYLISTYALRTIGVVNRGLLCWIENGMLNDTIISLQEERITSSQMQSSVVFDIAATATIDLRYLAYIKKYGPPIEGVFDSVKLAEFI